MKFGSTPRFPPCTSGLSLSNYSDKLTTISAGGIDVIFDAMAAADVANAQLGEVEFCTLGMFILGMPSISVASRPRTNGISTYVYTSA